MLEIEKPNFTILEESEDGSYGKFCLEPLERGFGTTIGNPIRRVLLSSLQGTAVTSIKIDGIVHEFSTVPGVLEDVTQIVLNVKGIIARLFSDEPKTLEIFANGPGIVTAGDIKADSEVEIVNKDHVIATLNEDAKDFHMELVLERGRGYVSADRNKELRKSKILGEIAVDSIFTPVIKVNYTVENTRVGKFTDYDKLTMEIWTNGVLTAREALSMACAIFDEHVKLMILEGNSIGLIERKVTERKLENGQIVVSTIDDLDLSARAYNCLKRAGILTIEQLLKTSRKDLERIRNFGKVSIDEVEKQLAVYGLSFKEDDDEDDN